MAVGVVAGAVAVEGWCGALWLDRGVGLGIGMFGAEEAPEGVVHVVVTF